MGEAQTSEQLTILLDDVVNLASMFGNGYTAESAGRALTCPETDMLATAFARCGQVDDAAAVLYGHATGDDRGDEHFDMSWSALREYARMLIGERTIVDVLEQALADAGGDNAGELRERWQRTGAVLDGLSAGLHDRADVAAALAECRSWADAEYLIVTHRGRRE
ncbi:MULTISPECIES: hypothetical protein [unclassified Pseudonocardia]|uniref:hypothetical protein n=1 Tax=unclassified Pseudonocardia TaxID=2619320 RepID=UPI000AA9A1FF|nr:MULTISPECIES: hypothetical protein [unclassified Pseudonocardia]